MKKLALALAAWLVPALAAAGMITESDLDTLPAADVLVLGEVHDNPRHHQGQARAVAGSRPAALVFEMLTPALATRITPALRAQPDRLGRVLEWESRGWPEFAMYAPVFAAAPRARVFGGGVPREALMRAARQGPELLFGTEAARFGLTKPLPPTEQAAREAEMQHSHCGALPDEALPAMVMAQRIRDAALARAVLRALSGTGGPVAVITGNGHARHDRGLPAALSRAAPDLSITSLGQFETEPEETPPFDLWRVTAPAERPDPCARFRESGG